MSEVLGGYRSTPDFFNGVQIGSTEASENFEVGKHCTGMTCDGEWEKLLEGTLNHVKQLKRGKQL